MKIYNFACLVYKQLLIFPQVTGLPEHLAKNLSSIHVCLEVSQADFSRLLHLEWKYFAHLFRFAVTKESPYYSFGQCHCPDCFKPFLQARILYINLIFLIKKRIESCQCIFSLGEGLAVKPSPLKCPSALLKLFWNICSSTRYHNISWTQWDTFVRNWISLKWFQKIILAWKAHTSSNWLAIIPILINFGE